MNAANGLFDSEPAGNLSRERIRSLMSVLADGEASADELDELLRPDSGVQEGHGDWVTYHLIGEVLRGNALGHAPQTTDRAMAEAVSARLLQEIDRPQLLSVEPPQAVMARPAANDAVFRWQLVAGLASLVAVVAVTWTSLGGLAPTGDAAGAGPVAQAAPPPVVEPVQVTTVQTPLGPVTRDLQLEQLLAQHRQFGGVSAFQMPAGFIRNATYETAGSR